MKCDSSTQLNLESKNISRQIKFFSLHKPQLIFTVVIYNHIKIYMLQWKAQLIVNYKFQRINNKGS